LKCWLAAYTPLAYSLQVEFIETPIFTRLIRDLLEDPEYRQLQWALLGNPGAGALIPTGGWITQGTLVPARTGQARWASGHQLLG